MTRKINRYNFQFLVFNLHSIYKFLISNFKILVITILLILLVYTRFANIGWGLPYPMHPDERNMAIALQNLKCEFSIFNFQFSNLRDCFNPGFFAYGQLPLYLGYLIVWFLKFWDGDMVYPIGFMEAVFSLRLISAIASVINVYVILRIIELVNPTKLKDLGKSLSLKFKDINLNLGHLLLLPIFIFTPYFIQFSHFGTTESLLMLFYSLIILYSLRLLDSKDISLGDMVRLSLFSGMAMATKISSIIFLVIPGIVILSKFKSQNSKVPPSSRLRWTGKITIQNLKLTIGFLFFTLIFTFLFSPHNFLNWEEFVFSIGYEADVALGNYVVFYTRQFIGSTPVLFQLTKVFPYALGLGMGLAGLIGFIVLNWKDKKINFLRTAFLVYFLSSGFLYTKWTRFMAPVFPILTIFAVLFISKIKNLISKTQIKNKKILHFTLSFCFLIFYFLILVPGIKYLNVYLKSDNRLQASEWIYENIPEDSYIISETGNVVDIPIESQNSKIKSQKFKNESKNYHIVSFNFYDLDENILLQRELREHLENADYIFVPSRRIFANSRKEDYPVLNKYYQDLFSGKLGFEQVAEFSSGLNDEQAEETWSVFDHPVIRIYKKVQNSNLKDQNHNSNFKSF